MSAIFPRTAVPARASAMLWLVVIGYLVYVGVTYHDGYAAVHEDRQPLYTDFTHSYAASLILRDQAPEDLFRDNKMADAMQDAARAVYGETLSEEAAQSIGFNPWMYPPTFMLVIAPLALIPYMSALLAWTVLTALPYLAAMRMILRDANAWPAALAAPPAFSNLMFGQTGFLSGGLIGIGLALLLRRPALAGLCIGLASVKPHLGLLIPIALAAGGHWRTFGVATITTVALILASAVIYGMEPWYATIGSFDYYIEGFKVGAYNFNAMTSVLSTVRLLGGSVETMWLAQNAASALMAAVVAWVWWRGRERPDTIGLQSAILCFAAPLAVPMVYVYDLVLIVPAVAWLWCDFRARGARGWEILVLIGSLGALLGVYPLAKHFGIQLGAVCVAMMLGLALFRYFDSTDVVGRAFRAESHA